VPNFDQDLATFLLVRGPYAWLGYGYVVRGASSPAFRDPLYNSCPLLLYLSVLPLSALSPTPLCSPPLLASSQGCARCVEVCVEPCARVCMCVCAGRPQVGGVWWVAVRLPRRPEGRLWHAPEHV
jgi:hypothetical protein